MKYNKYITVVLFKHLDRSGIRRRKNKGEVKRRERERKKRLAVRIGGQKIHKNHFFNDYKEKT